MFGSKEDHPRDSTSARKRARRAAPTLVGALTLTAALLGFAASASAGTGFAVTPNIPLPNRAVSVGETNLPSTVTILNGSDGAQENLNVRLTDIFLVPSCQALVSGDCPIPADPDVFALSATGMGRTGTACANITFTIANVDQAQDKYQLVPNATITLGPAFTGGPAARCTIDYTATVLKRPTGDAVPTTDGVQTNVSAWAEGVASDGQPGDGSGSNRTTVNRAAPSIATNATPGFTVGEPGTLSDVATVSGRVNPTAGATIDFLLYGPGDETCTGTPVFRSLDVPYPVAGGQVTSSAYTPTQPGTYRWVAVYSGDANNSPVTGLCNAANENVVVRAAPTISTNASPGFTLGEPGTLSDVAIVSGRLSAVAGATIDFRLYGPGDATCTGRPVFESLNVPYPVAGGSVTSAAYTPGQAGTYYWVASYSGDVNNAPVAGRCNEATETRTIGPAGTPPPPPPPPPAATPPAATPPAPPPPARGLAPANEICTTPPGPAPAGSALCARGTAAIRGRTGCQGTAFSVAVTGRQIERVVFTLDGRTVRTLSRPNSGSRWVLPVNPRKLRSGVHRVLARTTFSAQSGTRSRTLRVTFSRCSRRAAAPSFTG